MSRRKRTSTILTKAERRAAAMMSIQPDLDLGNGLTLDLYWQTIEGLRQKQQRYNTLLSTIDQLYNEVRAEERALGELSDHMLSGVKAKFGRDSYEYEMAGGVRRSERKRPRQRVALSA